MTYLRVRNLSDDAVVHSVRLNSNSPAYVERVIAGLTSRIDLERFYVDDSEVDAALTPPASVPEAPGEPLRGQPDLELSGGGALAAGLGVGMTTSIRPSGENRAATKI